MADWTKSMQRTYEYYMVDPNTWKDMKLIDNVKSCSITRDYNTETLGSATIDIVESVGECYIRIYMITIQNGIREKHPLGTYLVQTPSSTFNGKVRNVSMDAYTPLLELKENQPPLGYSMMKGDNIMDTAYRLIREHARAPVVSTTSSDTLPNDFVADPSDTWLTFIQSLISNAKYYFALDEMGRILFAPKQKTESLQPVWTFDDSNSSILCADFDMEHDLYGVPNAIEVIYSNGIDSYYKKVINDDPNSPTSTVSRGREICKRVTDISVSGDPTQYQIEQYAEQLLREVSTLEYTITYTHGYCPVRIGDCVRLNYERAGITDIKARVLSQSITCDNKCQVSETAVFTTELWR